MGYYSTVEGEITITPPITWGELRRIPGDPDETWWSVKLPVSEETAETDEGTVIRRYVDKVTPAREDGYKAGKLEEHVQEVIDAFPGHVFSGYLEVSGEEPGDLWRVHVKGGRAIRVDAEIVWPEP